MAGDWIKMRNDLYDDPRVIRISTLTCPDHVRECAHRYGVIGRLYYLWTVADRHTTDGFLRGLMPRNLDEMVELPGWTSALAEVGWIDVSTQGLKVPRFKEHNGVSAKQRAQCSKRVQKHRAKSQNHVTHKALHERYENVTRALPEQEQQQQQEKREDKSKASSARDVVQSLGDVFRGNFAAAAAGDDLNFSSAAAAAPESESPTSRPLENRSRLPQSVPDSVQRILGSRVLDLINVPTGNFIEALAFRGCPAKLAMKAIQQVDRQLLQQILRITENSTKIRTGGGWNRILFKPETFGLARGPDGLWRHEDQMAKGTR